MLMATFMHLTCLAYLSHACVKRVRNDGDHAENVEAVMFLLCWRTFVEMHYGSQVELGYGERYLKDTSDVKQSNILDILLLNSGLLLGNWSANLR